MKILFCANYCAVYLIPTHGVTRYFVMNLQVGFMGQNSHISSEFDEVGFNSSKCAPVVLLCPEWTFQATWALVVSWWSYNMTKHLGIKDHNVEFICQVRIWPYFSKDSQQDQCLHHYYFNRGFNVIMFIVCTSPGCCRNTWKLWSSIWRHWSCRDWKRGGTTAVDEGGDEIRGSCACTSSNEGGNEQDASSQISCKYQRPP